MIALPSRRDPRLPLGLLLLTIAVLGLLAANLYLSGRQGDWHHFYFAAQAIAEGANPYEAHDRGYLYPALFAFALQPLLPLGFEVAGAVWVLVMAGCMAGMVWMAQSLLKSLSGDAVIGSWVTAGAFLLVAEKMYSTLKNAQTDALILFCFVAALYWIVRRPAWAGLAIALAAAIKYHALIFVIVFLVRRDFKAAAAALTGFTALLLLPALQVGWAENLHWLGQTFGGLIAMVQNVASDRSGTAPLEAAAVAPISWERSLSLTSALSRLGDHLPGPLVMMAFLALIMFCVAVVMRSYAEAGLNTFWRPRIGIGSAQQGLLRLCDWSLAVTIILVYSPQTTGRHYMLAFLPMMMLGLAAAREVQEDGTRTSLFLMASIPLALYLPPSDLESLLGAWKAVGGLSWVFLSVQLVVLRRFLIRLGEDASPAGRT